MLTIAKETKTGLMANIWDIKEIRVINSITVLYLYGFWDLDHFNKYNDGLIQAYADIIPIQVQRDDDPFSIIDPALGVQITSWINEGKSLRQIYKRLYENFIMIIEPFSIDWGVAAQDWS